jgi:hypothetical protein
MDNKRGIGHLEAVLAFVFFIGFLTFAFIFFNPFQSNRTLDTSLEYAFIEVKDFAEKEVEIYSVSINSAVINNLVAIDIPIPIPNSFASVGGADGNIIPSHTDNNGVVYFDRNGINFVRIKYSDDFPPGPAGLVNPNLLVEGTDYVISSSESKILYSENKFLELNSSYYSDYQGIKNLFNLPNRIDFGFSIIFDDDFRITGERNIPENLEAIADIDRIGVIRSNNNVEFADLITKVW